MGVSNALRNCFSKSIGTETNQAGGELKKRITGEDQPGDMSKRKDSTMQTLNPFMKSL
jgi:hypothetical protein